MITKLLKTNKEGIKKAAMIIRNGGLVAFPTETVYGLGANALDAKAVRKIFVAKGRPADNPLIVHIANKKIVYELALEVPAKAEMLMDRFWPGPLTLVLKKKKIVPDEVTCGMDTVAIRMPDHKVAIRLIKESGVPIAAPSANISTKPSPTTAEHVKQDMDGKIDAIIDGEKADIGVESTVIDMTVKPALLLRPGGITFEQLEKVLGKRNVKRFVQKGKMKEAKSPGMKYRHYSPNAEIILIEGKENKVREHISELALKYKKKGKKVGIITGYKKLECWGDICHILAKNPKSFARDLFSSFRKFDEKKIDIILVEGIEEKEIGMAVMNRIGKAAKKIVKV